MAEVNKVFVAGIALHEANPYKSLAHAQAGMGRSNPVKELELLDGPGSAEGGVYLIFGAARAFGIHYDWRLKAASRSEEAARRFCAASGKIDIPGYGEVDCVKYYWAPWGPTWAEFDRLRKGVMDDLTEGLESGRVTIL